MVRCNAVDGQPCKCMLAIPEINYWVKTMKFYLIKQSLGTITLEEFSELNTLLNMPNSRIYLNFYMEELNNERCELAENILESIDDE